MSTKTLFFFTRIAALHLKKIREKKIYYGFSDNISGLSSGAAEFVAKQLSSPTAVF